MALHGRKKDRVRFEFGYAAHIMAIDGTWQRDCLIDDVSATGAKLLVKGSIEGLNLNEFFLMLSHTGIAHRRCRLVRINGDEIGVMFIRSEALAKDRLKLRESSMDELHLSKD